MYRRRCVFALCCREHVPHSPAQSFDQASVSQGFFEGCDSGSQQFDERFNRAKKKFFDKYKSSASARPIPAPAPAAPPAGPSAEDKAAAQSAKEVGNNKLRSGDLDGALEAYSNAIELDSTCAVFYANRAAVYTKKAGTENLELAVADCQEAIALDPSYSKAYSRLGLAYYHLGRYEEAVRLSSSPRAVISSLCDPMQSVSTEPGLVRLCGRLLFLCLVCPFA